MHHRVFASLCLKMVGGFAKWQTGECAENFSIVKAAKRGWVLMPVPTE